MNSVSTFRFPLNIRYGLGARADLAHFSKEFGVSRPLFVTDVQMPRTRAFKLIVAEGNRIWPGAEVVFSGVHPNPTDEDVVAAWEAYSAGGCDAIIGIGGGSSLDVARAVRIREAFPATPLHDAPLDQLPESLPPFCAIPTTAGTGSEVGRSSVITIRSKARKVILGARQLVADMAILDPELTFELPPHLTAATGIDALTHAIEAFVCPVFHPMCDAIGLEAVRFVRLYLERAYRDGFDLEARGGMLLAASMGAIAFQKDLGAAHSLAHPLSSEFDIHHGLANALVHPRVVRFNGVTDSDQYDRVAKALDLDPTSDPASAVATFLEELNKRVGITQRLSDLGVPRDSLGALAKLAMEDECHKTNPRVCSEEDMLQLYMEAYDSGPKTGLAERASLG